ncbi:MAG: thioredoxin-dependent thiol peroxidase [Verrucomicrobiota bacterium]|nr:thioredoxin-dependent thiol peroxidase [Limisphaera sp.]MDW8381879.1 thioredoxin-dependent thiol peroxidase [Verrucomicrobiota bacterium]
MRKREKESAPGTWQEGDRAPDFEGVCHDGRVIRLCDFRGQWVVLYFYPRDHTPGCTLEACSFRDTYDAFTAHNTTVVGVSSDSTSSHARFVEKLRLPFYLVSDPKGNIVRAYGALGTKRFMGRLFQGTRRMTFLIDPDGYIRRIWHKVRPLGHAQEVLAELSALQQQKPHPDT